MLGMKASKLVKFLKCDAIFAAIAYPWSVFSFSLPVSWLTVNIKKNMIFDAFCLVVGTRRTILEVAGNLMKGD